MKSIYNYVLAVALSVAAVNAAPVPNNSDYLGLGKVIQITGTINTYGGNGGEFAGKLGKADPVTPANLIDPINTSFWCIDSQLSFSLPSTIDYANVIRMDGLTAANTQYMNKTGAAGSSSGFTNDLGGSYSALDRFKMAAYLVSQYAVSIPSDDDKIQRTIWGIIHNSASLNSQTGLLNAGFLANAIANYSTVDTTRWAVVSWVTTVSGDLAGSPDRQTFLVQVVPEPGFYGVLALGLSGVFLAVKRRKQS